MDEINQLFTAASKALEVQIALNQDLRSVVSKIEEAVNNLKVQHKQEIMDVTDAFISDINRERADFAVAVKSAEKAFNAKYLGKGQWCPPACEAKTPEEKDTFNPGI